MLFRRRPEITEPTHRATQRQAFGQLVDQGVYSLAFEHSADSKAFFTECVRTAIASTEGNRPVLSVLECGCGTGAWLDLLPGILERAGHTGQYFGFDLTPEMVAVARRKLGPRVPPQNLRVGDVLERDAYIFPGARPKFDVIYAYDLIQQLPRAQQLRGCETMASRLDPGGVLVVFDNESRSAYGAKVGAKKFLTQRFGLNLVPRFYCNARYPALRYLRRCLRRKGFSVQICASANGPKRALIARAAHPAEDPLGVGPQRRPIS